MRSVAGPPDARAGCVGDRWPHPRRAL